jgi:2-succinyl-6-hydroxy-2,4-cyclohexadiene-1-carboxylate synthase
MTGSDSGAGALVLLHGFTHTGASWRGVTAALGERYTPFTPDIRGHGEASGAEPVTLAAVLDDLERLPPQRFALAGYSMGGRIALHAALSMPTRVSRLTLISASPGLEDPRERAARARDDEALATRLEHSTIEQFAAEWERTPVLAGLPQAAADAARRDRLRSTPAGLARALRGLGTGALPPLWERLGDLSMPVTLLAGERDAKFSAIAARMATAIPAARLEIVPGVGHSLHLEAPALVASLLQ